jgi:cytochrome o ubiquinol oxidase subunit 2
MSTILPYRSWWRLTAAAVLMLLGGCRMVVLDPAGDVAAQQRDLVLEATALMLIVIVPVIVLTLVFARRYRASNHAARYEPDWDHSTQLELVIWAVPLLIIICLGALTWVSTHLLDPYRGLTRLDAQRAVPAAVTPLRVDVVALDWKWLFIYPQYGIATVNELAAPVDRPIEFRITSATVMNAFYVPALAGMVYAMPAMQMQLHAVINQVGVYDGFSANYSGAGFSGMHFAFRGVTAADFDSWVQKARQSGGNLDRAAYLQLAQPSQNEPVRRYARTDPALFGAILGLCVEAGRMCTQQMMAIDMSGGAGVASAFALGKSGDAGAGRSGYVAALCTRPDVRRSEWSTPDSMPFLPEGVQTR